MAHIEPAVGPHPQVHLHGEVPPEAAAYAVGKVEAALHHAPGAVLRMSLTLDSAAPGDRVDAHIDVDGVGVHVHAVGQTMQEATDLMQERLRSRLRRIRRRPAQGPRPPAPRPDRFSAPDGPVSGRQDAGDSEPSVSRMEEAEGLRPPVFRMEEAEGLRPPVSRMEEAEGLRPPVFRPEQAARD